MTNKRNRMVILILVLILGFSSTAYAQSQGGTFTLTDIPSMFNGMYVFLVAGHIEADLFGAQSVDWDAGSATLPLIVNGRVSIPMWLLLESKDGLKKELIRYNGNHAIDVLIFLSKSATLDDDSEEIAEIYFESVRFSNGSATMSFHDNDNFETY